jgi:hypothetical protein
LLAESVTEVMWLVAPTSSLADNTRRSPAVVGVDIWARREVLAVVSVPLAVCTRRGVALAAGTTREKVEVCVPEEAIPVIVMG